MFDQMMRVVTQHSGFFYQQLEPHSENLANSSTYGYKGKRFEMYVRPDGAVDMTSRVDQRQGPLEMTQRELDIAIEGPGYIPVTRENGDVAYTRHGGFKRNSEGYIITMFGDIVGDGIQIPPVYDKLNIHADGSVNIIVKPGEAEQKIGDIPVVVFANPEGLKISGENLYKATADSGKPTKLTQHDYMKQFFLERSNVSTQATVHDILKINAGALGNLRLAKFIDDLYREGINLRQ